MVQQQSYACKVVCTGTTSACLRTARRAAERRTRWRAPQTTPESTSARCRSSSASSTRSARPPTRMPSPPRSSRSTMSRRAPGPRLHLHLTSVVSVRVASIASACVVVPASPSGRRLGAVFTLFVRVHVSQRRREAVACSPMSVCGCICLVLRCINGSDASMDQHQRINVSVYALPSRSACSAVSCALPPYRRRTCAPMPLPSPHLPVRMTGSPYDLLTASAAAPGSQDCTCAIVFGESALPSHPRWSEVCGRHMVRVILPRAHPLRPTRREWIHKPPPQPSRFRGIVEPLGPISKTLKTISDCGVPCRSGICSPSRRTSRTWSCRRRRRASRCPA